MEQPNDVPPPVGPGDYFTGPNLNTLIEELTENDRPGPPPAPASAIEAMPTVYINAAHLTDGSQCPVCKEDFSLGEEAREMPCKHVYHSDCIVPWLSLHNSCPVCRYQLSGDGGRNNNSRGGVGGRERSGARGGDQADGQPARWSPVPLLWPFQEWRPGGWDHQYRRSGRAAAEDVEWNPGGNDLVVLHAFLLVFICFLLLFFFV